MPCHTWRGKTKVIGEEYVHFPAVNAIPKAMTLQEIQRATQQDKTLQCVSWLIRNRKWHKLENLPSKRKEAPLAELKLFRNVQFETESGTSLRTYHKNTRKYP